MHPHIQFKPEANELHLLDQRLLPLAEEWFVCRNMADIITALKEMVIRGAPAIGVTAAYGCCIAAGTIDPNSPTWRADLDTQLADLARARPTAVNLTWAVALMRQTWQTNPEMGLVALCTALLKKSSRGGLIIIGDINLGGSIEPIHNPVPIAEIAVEKGATALLMPVACRRQLFDLSDEMATKVDIQFYSDAKDALLKAIVE